MGWRNDIMSLLPYRISSKDIKRISNVILKQIFFKLAQYLRKLKNKSFFKINSKLYAFLLFVAFLRLLIKIMQVEGNNSLVELSIDHDDLFNTTNTCQPQTTIKISHCKVNSTFQRLKNTESIQQDFDMSGEINLIEPFKNQSPTDIYKCFKCYGREQSSKNCYQCNGTGFINSSHPLANLFQQILIAKVMDVGRKTQKSNLSPKNTSFFCNQVSITEQESCVMQQCSHCGRQEDNAIMRYCDQCTTFCLCPKCFSERKYIHPNHNFYAANPRLSILEGLRPTMKKISEENEQQFSCTNNQESNQFKFISDHSDLKCNACQSVVQECYQICLDCEKVGQLFVLCAQCSNSQWYDHPESHELALRTLNQASNLRRIQSSPEKESLRNSSNALPDIAHVNSLDSRFIEKHFQGGKGFLSGLKQNQKQSEVSQKNNSSFFADWDPQQNKSFFNTELSCSKFFSGNQLSHSSFMSPQQSPVNFYRSTPFAAPFNPQNGKLDQQKFDKFHRLQKLNGQVALKEVESVEEKSPTIKKTQLNRQLDLQSSIINIQFSTQMDSSPTRLFNNRLSNHQTKPKIGFLQTIPLSQQTIPPKYKSMIVLNNKQEDYLFTNYVCDICSATPIRNKRYHCRQCEDYDICQDCYIKRSRQHDHKNFQLIDGHELLKQKKQEMIEFQKNNMRKILDGFIVKQFFGKKSIG